MASRATTRPQDFIDLTLSDDEISGPGQARRFYGLSPEDAQMLRDLSGSHHGLTLPAVHNSNRQKSTWNSRNQYKNGSNHEPSASFAGTASNASVQRLLPRSSSQIPAAPSSNPVHRVRGGQPLEENGLRNLADGPRPANSMNLRPSRASAAPQIRIPGPHGGGVIPSGRISLGDENRSIAVEVENPAKRRKTTAGFSPADEDVQNSEEYNKAKLEVILKEQVFPPIKAAVKRYRERLSADDRAEIGQKASTAGVLVKDDSFAADCKANGLSLSSAYEKCLATKARRLVNQYANAILANGPIVISSRDPPPRIRPSKSNGLADTTNRSTRQKSLRSTRSSSIASETEGHVFEPPPILPPKTIFQNGNQRKYSSSPATSMSNDPMELDQNTITVESAPVLTSAVRRTRHSAVKYSNKERSSSRPVVLIESATPVKVAQVHETKESGRLEKKPLHVNFNASQGRVAPRPYVSFNERNNRSSGTLIRHVDFSSEEIEYLCKIIQPITGGQSLLESGPAMMIASLMSGQERAIPQIYEALLKKTKGPGPGLGRQLLRAREPTALKSFLGDAVTRCVTTGQRLEPKVRPISRPRPSILSQLHAREFIGLAPPNFCLGEGSFKEKAMSCLEDSLTRISEWTDCCGDIATISWTGEETFVCGAVAHSDYHNMQYNKPGNLGVGSLSLGTLKALPDHRVVRPLIGTAENAENALESMRRTQDPWLYTSVVSSTHNEENSFTFTASFDKTVKVWSVSENGSTMALRGIWEHEDKVNFVVTSEHHDRVATAADVCNNAIRVYNFDEEDISNTPYDTYTGERAREQAQELRRRDTWAYFPATMQWGKAPSVGQYLLVGYSPRSISGHETDIPEDKKNTGELCIWDVEDMSKIHISSAKSTNAFEVLWHPTQPFFVAATSPTGHFESDTRTQIRLFARKELGAFFVLKILDCPALDINELTMMPNSDINSWVTASCTDGNTYVWDTAGHSERPVHVLNHGDSLDNPLPELPREIGDEGVKFCAWGQSSQRFYTGSSDGRVKAWNVHAAPGKALVRHVLEVSGGITFGTFSKDFSKLLIGDATGKVHLLAYDDSDLDHEDQPSSKPPTTSPFHPGASSILLRKAFQNRPKVIIPHPEPATPMNSSSETIFQTLEQSGVELAFEFLFEQRLTIHSDPAIGAIQGPAYAATNLFRLDAHIDNDASKPLLPEFEAKQQHVRSRTTRNVEFKELPRVKCSDRTLHEGNERVERELEGMGVEMRWDYRLEREMMPRFRVFGERREREVEREVEFIELD